MFFSLIPISILLVVLIKILVNVNTQREVETAEGRESRQPKEGQEKKEIDIKGTISIAITITSFLIALTQLQSGSNSNSNTTDPMSLLQVIIFSVVSFAIASILYKDRRKIRVTAYGFELDKRQILFPIHCNSNNSRYNNVYDISNYRTISKALNHLDLVEMQ